MPARNLAIMLTDIKGFTARTSESTRVGMVSLLAEHDRLLLPVFRYYDGTVVKTLGDAFLVRFDSATDAVLAGLAIQEVLRQHNAFVEERDRLEVRVAINAGDVEAKEGDVLGEPVNVVARLETVTEPGEVWFTESVYLSMNRAEVPSAEVGERVFKGISRPVRVYKVIRDPGSEQVRRLAEGVRLTREGPVLKGLREPRRKGRGWIAWSAAAVMAALVAVVFAVCVMEDPAERAIAEAEARSARGECLSALEVLDVELASNPGDARLVEAAVRAAEGHLEFLLHEREKGEALAWLQQALERRPVLEPLRKRIPPLDADVTVHRLYLKRRHSDDVWSGIRELLQRYPKEPEVPFIAKKILEEWYIPEAGLWLHEEAIKRGMDPSNPGIFGTIESIFEKNEPEKDAKAAHTFAREHCEAQRLPWAKQALETGTGFALLNGLVILEERGDPAAKNPFHLALKAVVESRDLEAACAALLAVKEPVRGARARDIVNETLKRAGEGPVLRSTLETLVARWGPVP